MSTASTRATDGNRNDTCEVLDSALSEGQLSTEEHRQRVKAAINATTLGELQSLVSDLQIRSAPVPLPKLKSLAGSWGIRIAVLVVLVFLGVGIGWALYRNSASPHDFTPDRGAKSDVASPAVVTPQAAPTQAPTAAPPQASPQPQAPTQLLSLGGLSGLIAQIRSTFGDTLGYELVVYPDHAGLTRPDSVNAHKIVAYTCGGNGWSKNLGASRPPDTVVGDLGKFDIQAVMGALHAAPQTLHMDGGKVENMIIEAANDGTLVARHSK